MAQYNQLLKRLRLEINAFLSHRPSSPDETTRESSDKLPISYSNHAKASRPFRPAPHRARRGGARSGDRAWRSSVFLPKRTINYDLAESFVDHSTNPLSSDLYGVRFKHAAKQWPNGRFINYAEKLDKQDGRTIAITCSRTFPITRKKKKNPTVEQTPTEEISSVVLVAPADREHKRKLADQQTNFYANFLGRNRFATAPSIKKTNGLSDPIKTAIAIPLNGENKEDQLC